MKSNEKEEDKRGILLPLSTLSLSLSLLVQNCISNADGFPKGYFLLNRATLAASDGLFAQLWKEYALSDSRYLTGDVFTLCVEAITVVSFLPQTKSLLSFSLFSCSPPSHNPLFFFLFLCFSNMGSRPSGAL